MTTCHPDRPTHAKGLCATCYNREKQKRLYIQRREKWAKQAEKAKIPTVAHTAQIKAKYGLSSADYWKLFDQQAHSCAVCKRFPRARKLAVDHRHSDGLIRGLLCWKCNYVIGMLSDRPEAFANIAEYLTNPPAVAIIGERKVPVRSKKSLKVHLGQVGR